MYAVMRSLAIAASRLEWALEIAPCLLGGQSICRGESLATMTARCNGGF